MSPSVSEIREVLDWRAVSVLREVDDGNGATVETVAEATGFDHERARDRCQQLSAVGLVTEVDIDGDDGYELTGRGHSAVGAGLYDQFEMVGGADIDDLADRVAGLLDRRDDLREEVEQLRDDATEVREQATHHFGDRDDVTEEFESLLSDIDSLAEGLAEN